MPESLHPVNSPGTPDIEARWAIRNEEEKKKQAEKKRKEEEARRRLAAEARKPKPKDTSKYPIPLPINAFRDATKPNKADNPILGTAKSLARTADRAVTNTVEKTVEGAAEAVLFGASVQQRVGRKLGIEKAYKSLGIPVSELPKQWDPLEKEYKAWQMNLPKPTAATPLEQVGADIVTFAITTLNVARSLPKVGLLAASKGKGLGMRIAADAAVGIPSGAAADFLLTKKGDGNLANMVDALPFGSKEAKNALKLGLAEDDDDNALTYKAKAVATGAIGGTVLQALTGLLFMRRATQAYLKMGLPKEEAVQRGVAQGAIDLSDHLKANQTRADKEWPEAIQKTFANNETGQIKLRAAIDRLKEQQAAQQQAAQQQAAQQQAAQQQKALSGAQGAQEGASATPQVQTPSAVPEARTGALRAAQKRFDELLNSPDPDANEFDAAGDELDRLMGLEKAEADPKPQATEADDELALQIKAKEEDLQKLVQEADQFEADLATPLELRESNEKATFDDSGPGPQVAVDQAKLETSIPKVAQRTDIPEGLAKAAKTAPVLGKSRHHFTDAAFKIMAEGEGVTEDTMKTLRGTLSEAKLNLMAKEARLKPAALIRLASDAIVAFRGPEARRLDAEEFFNFLRDQDLLYKRVGDATVEGDPELLTPVGIVALKTMVTDTANQILDLSKGIIRDDLDKRLPGSAVDRLIDRIVVLHDLHAMSAQIDGSQLRSYQEMVASRADRAVFKISKQKLGAAKRLKSHHATLDKARRTELKIWAAEAKAAFRAGDNATYGRRIQDIANALVLSGGDPLKQVQITDLIRRGLWQNSFTSMYNSMLSGAKTLQRATTGNTSSILTQPLSVALAGAAKGDMQLFRSAFGAYHGIVDSLGDAFKVAYETARLNEGLNADPKYIVEVLANNDKLGAMRTAIDDTVGTPLYNIGQDYTLRMLETLVKFNKSVVGSYPERLMLAIDDFSKVISSRSKIAMDASLEAQRAGGSKEDFLRIYEGYRSSKIRPDLSIEDDALLDYANMSTFQADPGGFVNAISLAMEKLPAMRLLIPFVKTPANVLIYSAELFPLTNQLSKRFRQVMALTPDHPDFDPILRAEYEGRQAVGAMVATGAIAAAFAGNMTGNGPPPGIERDLWLKQHPPKSIRTPFGWVSYEAIDPLQVFMATAADIVMMQQMGKIDEWEAVAHQMGFALGMAVTDRSMLQGLASLGAFLNLTATDAMDKGHMGLMAMVNNFIPMSGLRREMSNAINPYMREIDDNVKKMQATAFPTWAAANPPKVDPLTGEPFTSLSGGVWNAFSPFRVVQAEFPAGSPEAKAQRIAGELSNAGWDSSTLTTKGVSGEELLPDERAAFGRALYDVGLPARLEDLFDNNPYYREAVNQWKAEGDSTTAKGSLHHDMIQGVVRAAKSQAAARMMVDNPALIQRHQLRLQRNAFRGQGRTQEADQLQKQIDDLIKISK